MLFIYDSFAHKTPVAVTCGLYLFFVFEVVIDPLGIATALSSERVPDAVACGPYYSISNNV
jgi:ABC-type microcin C transport system permease subunit YejB